MKKYKVIIVDDQAISRELFRLTIENNPQFELVAVLDQAYFIDTYLIQSKVDLILMDILMGEGAQGLKVAKMIKEKYPMIKIMAITSMPEVSWIKQAQEIGIESFWYKDAPFETLVEAMEKTMAGEHVYPQKAPQAFIGLAKSDELTSRELDVLRQMTTGASNSVIAKRLCMSENTVKTHIRHLLEKTGCENRTELAIKARLSGLVISDDE